MPDRLALPAGALQVLLGRVKKSKFLRQTLGDPPPHSCSAPAAIESGLSQSMPQAWDESRYTEDQLRHPSPSGRKQ